MPHDERAEGTGDRLQHAEMRKGMNGNSEFYSSVESFVARVGDGGRMQVQAAANFTNR
jgi:hypothetical protein